jgi:8-oxo-dGTP pyrophosphatase MutT (NUDIX family)
VNVEVRAAGGVVRRRRPDGPPEVLLVHRSKHRDWTFPKGKAEGDEADEACALREVEEEALVRCILEEELSTVRYSDARGRPKRVRYWAMRPTSGVPGAGDGVDEVRWLTVPEAAHLLTYERDREVLAALGDP